MTLIFMINSGVYESDLIKRMQHKNITIHILHMSSCEMKSTPHTARCLQDCSHLFFLSGSKQLCSLLLWLFIIRTFPLRRLFFHPLLSSCQCQWSHRNSSRRIPCMSSLIQALVDRSTVYKFCEMVLAVFNLVSAKSIGIWMIRAVSRMGSVAEPKNVPPISGA